MKTGDKVRFLNAVGGGIVRRFQNKDIVIVEEDDGFETPVLIRECVVIEEKNILENNIPRKPLTLPGKDVFGDLEQADIEAAPAAVRELLISATDLQEAMTQKTKADQTYRQPASVRKNKTPDILEVDLHINQLLDSTAGLNSTDMLSYQLSIFRKTMEENKTQKGRRIVFIHGKGDGVLRNALLTELKTKYKNFPFQDASFREYGFGATMVTVR